MTGARGHQLATRVWVGAVLIALLVGLLWHDASRQAHHGLWAILTVAVAGSMAEFYALAQRRGLKPLRGLGVVLGTALTALHGIWLQTDRHTTDPAPALLLLAVAASFAAILMRPPAERREEDLSVTLLGFLYLWLPLSFAMRLRSEPAWGGSLGMGGQAALLFALAAGKGSDIGAYFVGSRIGRNLLAPTLSPKKTWEGLGGAALGGALAGWAVARLWPALPAREAQAAVLGGLIGLGGQAADLSESFLKRQAGAKDSGSLLPAFGGILDLMDSLVLALPGAYYGLLACRRWAA